MSYSVFSPLIKTSVFCVFISPLPSNSWQPLILLLSPLFCLFQNGIQLESVFLFSLKRGVQSLYAYKSAHGPPMCGQDRLQVANSPTKYCSFPSSTEPSPTGPAQQPGSGGYVVGICSQEGHKVCAPCHNEPRFLSAVKKTFLVKMRKFECGLCIRWY